MCAQPLLSIRGAGDVLRLTVPATLTVAGSDLPRRLQPASDSDAPGARSSTDQTGQRCTGWTRTGRRQLRPSSTSGRTAPLVARAQETPVEVRRATSSHRSRPARTQRALAGCAASPGRTRLERPAIDLGRAAARDARRA